MNKKIFKDFWVKFVSVLFAIALWYFVVDEKMRQVNFVVPLDSSMPKGVDVIPDKVRVTLRGEFNQILRLNSREIRIKAIPYARFLRDGAEAEATWEIKPGSVFVPSEFQVIAIEPSTVKLIKKNE